MTSTLKINEAINEALRNRFFEGIPSKKLTMNVSNFHQLLSSLGIPLMTMGPLTGKTFNTGYSSVDIVCEPNQKLNQILIDDDEVLFLQD